MVVELRDAASRLMQELRREPSRVAAGPAESLVAALVNLGYRQPDAEKAAAAAVQEVGATAAFADLLRTSLKKLSRA
jgi:Holliday junction DNA helicase RuvA